MDNSPALKIPDESEEESERYENVIQRAESLLRNGQALKAAAVLEPLLSEASEKYEDNDRVLYRDFNDLVETVLYLKLFNPSKSIVTPPVNRSELYRVYGYAMVDLERFEDAKISLEMAVRLNPVGPRAIFEYTDLLKRTGNFQAMRLWTRQCLRFAYLPSQIAQAYRNFGYEFIERKEFRKAAALYYVSLCYEQNQQATSELFYIMQMTRKKPEEPTPEEVKTIFKEENIQYGPGAPAVSALLRVAEHFEKEGCMEKARKYYGMLYDLTHDASVEDKLEQ